MRHQLKPKQSKKITPLLTILKETQFCLKLRKGMLRSLMQPQMSHRYSKIILQQKQAIKPINNRLRTLKLAIPHRYWLQINKVISLKMPRKSTIKLFSFKLQLKKLIRLLPLLQTMLLA
jgi:hypothetical protein